MGDQLESWLPARNRRKAAQQQGGVSLILVDRTMDLAGPVLRYIDPKSCARKSVTSENQGCIGYLSGQISGRIIFFFISGMRPDPGL